MEIQTFAIMFAYPHYLFWHPRRVCSWPWALRTRGILLEVEKETLLTIGPHHPRQIYPNNIYERCFQISGYTNCKPNSVTERGKLVTEEEKGKLLFKNLTSSFPVNQKTHFPLRSLRDFLNYGNIFYKFQGKLFVFCHAFIIFFLLLGFVFKQFKANHILLFPYNRIKYVWIRFQNVLINN